MMTSADNPKDDENLIPHGKNEYHSFALYGVVEGELYIAAARALALYRGTMNRTRFILYELIEELAERSLAGNRPWKEKI